MRVYRPNVRMALCACYAGQCPPAKATGLGLGGLGTGLGGGLPLKTGGGGLVLGLGGGLDMGAWQYGPLLRLTTDRGLQQILPSPAPVIHNNMLELP